MSNQNKAEKLYKAVKTGQVKLEDINEEGKQALRDYMGVKKISSQAPQSKGVAPIAHDYKPEKQPVQPKSVAPIAHDYTPESRVPQSKGVAPIAHDYTPQKQAGGTVQPPRSKGAAPIAYDYTPDKHPVQSKGVAPIAHDYTPQQKGIPSLPNLDPEFAREHPTFTRAMATITSPLRSVLERPNVKRLAEKSADELLLTDRTQFGGEYTPGTSETAENITDIGGAVLGSLPGYGGLYKGLGHLGTRLPAAAQKASPLVKTGVKGAAAGGIYEGAVGVGHQEDPGEVLKRAAIGAAAGGVGDVAITKAPQLIREAQEASKMNTLRNLDLRPGTQSFRTKAPKTEFEKTPVPTKNVTRKYEEQYNTEKEIKKQLRKYYSGFDEEGLDEATEAIKDLRRTESDIQKPIGDTEVQRPQRLDTGRGAGSGIQGGQQGGPGQRPYQTIGLNFSRDLIDTGKVNLTGHKIRDTKDLAVISQVFRDPRFETFRIFYTKGDKIVGTDAISSRMPNMAKAFVDEPAKSIWKIRQRMKRLDADGYYLLHNHPSGVPEPSQPDVNLTGRYAMDLPGFKGHVIIDSDKYSFLHMVNGQLRGKENIPLGLGEDRLLQPSVEHPFLGHEVNSPAKLANMAKKTQNRKDMATLFFMDNKLRVRGIQEVSKKMFNSDDFEGFLRNQAREHGGASTFAVGDSEIEGKLRQLIRDGYLEDAYVTNTGETLRGKVSPRPDRPDWMGAYSDKEARAITPPKPEATYRIPKFRPAEKEPPETLLLPEPGATSATPEPSAETAASGRNVEVMAGTPGGEAPVAAASSGRQVSRRQMIKDLEEALDVPVRVGRFNIPRALGIYKRDRQVVRSRLAENLPVISHEIGHHLDQIFNISETVHPDAAMRQELTRLGSTQPAHQFTEGIAEFLRHFLTGNTDDLKKAAPKFYDWFERTMKQEPRVYDALQRFKQDYQDYMNAPATARIKAGISTGEKKKRPVTWDRFMTAAVDDLRPIDSFVEKVTGGRKARARLEPTEDPFMQAQLVRGWTGKARQALHDGIYDGNFNKVGPSLKEVLKPVRDRLDDFRAYVVARRARELHNRGIETGYDRATVEQAIRDLDSPEFRQVQQDLIDYQDQVLNRLVESGVLSREQAQVMRELNQEYVPFYRVFDESAGGVGFGKRGFGDLAPPIKRLKGSGRTIVDPLESIIRNTYYLTNIAERNNVGRTLAEFANRREGTGWFVEKVDPKRYPIQFQVEDIAKKLEEVGVEVPDDALEEVLNVFRPSMMGSPGENILAVYRNGKRELYQLEPELYRAALMLDRESTNTLMKILSAPTSWLRAGAVLTPEFMVRNVLRDAMGSWVYSKYGFTPGVDTVRGLFHVLRRDDLYQKWLSSGGAQATFTSVDRHYLQEDIRKLVMDKWTDKAMGYGRHPLEILRKLSEFSEEATRLGEFGRAVKKEGATREGIQKAALASRDVTLDFGRAGTVGRPANQIIAFFNASVQGIDKMRRTFMKGGPKQVAKHTTKALTFITLPSVALWAINHDNPRYQELPDWRKDLFWNILTPDYIISIPKPFELGIVFGTLPERVLDWAYQTEPDAIQKWAETFKEVTAPDWIPTALTPIIEVMTNYSFFKGRPIVPMSEQRLPASMQYGPYTTETAKMMGRWAAGISGGEGVSPRYIEHMMQGYGGGLAMHGAAITDTIMRQSGTIENVRPEKTLADYPGIKAVLQEPYRGSASIDTFYKELEKLEKKAAAVKKYQKAGKPIPSVYKYDPGQLKLARKIQRDLAALRKQRTAVFNSKELSAEEKRKALKEINMTMINLVRRVFGREPAS